jgi:hypothetical protein
MRVGFAEKNFHFKSYCTQSFDFRFYNNAIIVVAPERFPKQKKIVYLWIVGLAPGQYVRLKKGSNPGASPTIASYNDCAAKIYNATRNLVRFENKNNVFHLLGLGHLTVTGLKEGRSRTVSIEPLVRCYLRQIRVARVFLAQNTKKGENIPNDHNI